MKSFVFHLYILNPDKIFRTSSLFFKGYLWFWSEPTPNYFAVFQEGDKNPKKTTKQQHPTQICGVFFPL